NLSIAARVADEDRGHRAGGGAKVNGLKVGKLFQKGQLMSIGRRIGRGICGCCLTSSFDLILVNPAISKSRKRNDSRRPMVTVMRPSCARVRKYNHTTPRARCPYLRGPGAGGAAQRGCKLSYAEIR